MLTAALELARAGYLVFPLKPGDKVPLGGQGHLDATVDEATIRQWWTAVPEANIGIACSTSGLLVVDVDPRNDGLESLGRFEETIGALPTETAAVKTGGGGYHFYYRLPPGNFPPNLSKHGFPGIDIKVKGYVACPPSLHASGDSYEWISRSAPVDLPPPLVDFLRSSPVDEVKPTEYSGGQAASPEILESAWQSLLEHGPSVKGQGGDNHAFRVGAILLGGYDLQWDDAWILAKRWNDHFIENNWNDARLAEKLRNGSRYASGVRGDRRRDFELGRFLEDNLGPFDQPTLAIEIPVDALPEEVDFLAAIKQAYADIQAYRTGTAPDAAPKPLFEPAVNLLTRSFPPTSWLVRGLVVTEGVGALAGEPKSNKTWQALEIALSVATNTPAFGKFETGAPTSVALFLAEDSARSVRNRLRALARSRKLDPFDALRNIHVSCREPIDLTDDAQLARLIASCRLFPSAPRLVVLDPMRDLHVGDEDSSREMSDVMGRFRAVRDILGTSVLFCHHSAKLSGDVAKRRRGQKMRGSGAIHGAVDFGLYLGDLDTDGTENWSTDVECEIKSAQGAGIFRLHLHVTDDEHGEAESVDWSVRPIGSGANDTVQAKKDVDEIVRALTELGGAATNAQIERHVSLGFSKVSRALDELLSRGWIAKKMRGKKKDGWQLSEPILLQTRAELEIK